MRKAFLVLFSLFTLFSYGQRINEYEFAIVPTKFQFQRSEHEYRLNALLKDRLQDFGFRSLYKNDPVGNSIDPCLCLDTEVVNVSNIFLTKLQIVFKDCLNGVVFQSEIGTSESKDRHESFNEALNNALKSVRNLNYKFNGVKKDIAGFAQNSEPQAQLNQGLQSHLQTEDYLVLQTKIENAKQEYALIQSKIEQAKRELVQTEQAKKEQFKAQQVESNPSRVVTKPKSTQVAIQTAQKNPSRVAPKEVVKSPAKTVAPQTKVEPAATETDTAVVKIPVEVAQSAEPTIAAVEEIKTSPENVAVDATKSMFIEKTDGISKEVLFASPVENGYQLIDSTSKVVLEMVNTVQPEYFNANVDKKYGVVYKKDNQWIFEYYFDGKLVVEQLNIRF